MRLVISKCKKSSDINPCYAFSLQKPMHATDLVWTVITSMEIVIQVASRLNPWIFIQFTKQRVLPSRGSIARCLINMYAEAVITCYLNVSHRAVILQIWGGGEGNVGPFAWWVLFVWITLIDSVRACVWSTSNRY